MSNTSEIEGAAGLLSDKLIHTQAVLHAAKAMADRVDVKPNIQTGDRDLESLIAVISVVHDQFDDLMREVDRRA